jgi:hypothetical protein
MNLEGSGRGLIELISRNFLEASKGNGGESQSGNISAFIQSYMNGSTDLCWALTAFSVLKFNSEPVGCPSGKQALQQAAFRLFRDVFA